MEAQQIAASFVGHATILLAVNLVDEVDPVLANFVPEDVPEADSLLDDDVLLGQVIRAPRSDQRVNRAVQWFDTVWFEYRDRAAIARPIRAELDRQRELPAILDLEQAMADAVDLLEALTRQTAFFRDTTRLRGVVDAVRVWQAAPSRANLLALGALCTSHGEPPGLPSTELVDRIGFFAREGSMLAGDYLVQHFNVAELAGWCPDELTRLLRSRYPLMRRCDVDALLAPLFRRTALSA